MAGVERFRVEVSGWDEEEVFFVEKSHPVSDEFAGNHVSLRRMLPEGAMVFVRISPAYRCRFSSQTARSTAAEAHPR